jgi:hypothetical protein
MKNLLKLSFQTNVRSKLSMLSILLAMVFLCISCGENTFKTQSEAEAETEVEASPTDNIHVAFAGGGWRAHTAHTGWTMSLLENNGNKLENVFKNVNTISSNSGGSWFSTMLMYSPKFVTDIEKPDALSNWAKTENGGWLGGQQKLFDNATFVDLACQDVSGEAFAACVFNSYADATKWNGVVDKIVFEGYPLKKQTLNSKRQGWASNKSLLIAATMLTNNVVMNEEGITTEYTKRYYQACLSATPTLNGYKRSTCDDGVTTDVSPVTFSSILDSLNLKTPPFLPAAGTGLGKSTFTIGYANNVKSDIKKRTAIVQNPLVNKGIPVINAAAASSAAIGFSASDNISGYWEASYKARDLAPSFSLKGSKVNVKDTYEMTMDHLKDNIMVRIADGGALDNSGVSQLVSFIQLNSKGKDDHFNIVAFDNVQNQPFLTGNHGAEAGGDIAMLFGYGLCQGNNFCSGCNCSGFCVNVPKLQIFEGSTIETPVTWSYQTKKDKESKYKDIPKLIYTKYTVTTTANPSFGIKPGLKGTFHSFTCVYPEAPTVPQNYGENKSFKAYNEMMQFINEGLKANENRGLTYLETAMGLK